MANTAIVDDDVLPSDADSMLPSDSDSQLPSEAMRIIQPRRTSLLPGWLGVEPTPGLGTALMTKAKEAFNAPGLVSPDQVPTGAQMTASTGLPKAVTVPASAVGKLGAGALGFVTSPKGMLQTAATKNPIAAPVVFAKWAYDMIKGAGASVEDATVAVRDKILDAFNRRMVTANQLGKPPESSMTDDQFAQRLAEDAVNAAALTLGGAGMAHGAVKGAAGLVRPTPAAAPEAPEGVKVPPTPSKPVLPQVAAPVRPITTVGREIGGQLDKLKLPAETVPDWAKTTGGPELDSPPITGKVTAENIDSLTPEQQATLTHGHGIEYGLTLSQKEGGKSGSLQSKYDAAAEEMKQAAQKGDNAAMKAAFGKLNFFGGALMGASSRETPNFRIKLHKVH